MARTLAVPADSCQRECGQAGTAPARAFAIYAGDFGARLLGMRLIGHLASETSARTFADYLVVQGIENRVEFETDGGWAVWVSDEDKLERAGSLLAGFQQNPSATRFQAEAKGAAKVRAERDKDEEAYRKRLRDRRQLFRPLTGYGFGAVTYGLIVLSVLVCIQSSFGRHVEPILGLFISDPTGGGNGLLPEIRRGELWRLLTPILIHFGPMHILFNMLWLRDLGSMIEGRQSPWYLGLMVLSIAVVSNLAQYFVSGPNFGGMSGVVYGLLGYIWIRGKFDPGSGLYVHPSTVLMMIVWFFVCMTGLLGPVANTVHGVGLGMGMAWGYLSSLRQR